MIIQKAALIALAAFLFNFAPSVVKAEGHTSSSAKSLNFNLKKIFFDHDLYKPALGAQRGSVTDISKIELNSKLTSIQTSASEITGCIEMLPYSHNSLMDRVGQAARVMANHSKASIEQLAFQPHFSGLKGPRLTIIRKDLEDALIGGRGSANEIYHNSKIEYIPESISCSPSLRAEWDVELLHKVDTWDSDNAPIFKSELILNNRIHFLDSFLATVSARYLLYDNFDDEPNFRFLNRIDPVRQDELGYVQSSLGLNRIMLSGFATPAEDFYVAGHAGYLEEMFFGVGGEFLYRPYKSALSVGGEIWGSLKRLPYTGSALAVDGSDPQISGLINIWYDVPLEPYTFGVSAGRFLDGDNGYQLHAAFKPSQGWKIEGYATHSFQSDSTINKDGDTNWIFGARLIMPLGQFRGIPDNSIQTVKLEPFARDHGQRLDNPYPLYDLTEAWQPREILGQWQSITAP